jgi:hypothetical protein
MDIVWFATAYSVLIVTFFRRQLLIERESRKIIFAISLALFMAAVVASLFMCSTPTLFPSLMNPLVSLGLFLLMRKMFFRWKHREPIDTSLDWRSGLAADRLFNVLYFTLGTFLMFLLYFAARVTGYRWH